MAVTPPDPELVASDVRRALDEDLGTGDLTAALLPETPVKAGVVCREAGILAGSEWFERCFRVLDEGLEIEWLRDDGEPITAGQTLCLLHGNARAIVSAERSALNFLQTLSGTATATRRYVDAVQDTGARILDTRKTLPGLRRAQKYAVTCGGGHNHRIGLYDAILIKENHIAACGSISTAVKRARALGRGAWIEVEVETMNELHEALEAGVERVMLDNFALDQLPEAVAINAGRARLEASGSIELDSLRAIAQTGVDDISIGALTKHLHALDLSLRIDSLDC